MFFTLIVLGVLFLLAAGVYAYGGNQPAVVGHSAGEIEEIDPTVPSNLKDGVNWSEISNRPEGLEDGGNFVKLAPPNNCDLGEVLKWTGVEWKCATLKTWSWSTSTAGGEYCTQACEGSQPGYSYGCTFAQVVSSGAYISCVSGNAAVAKRCFCISINAQ